MSAITKFKEPGSGLTMELGKWYVLSDSGSYYSADGFATPEAAVEWFKTTEDYDGAPYSVGVPEYTSAKGYQGLDFCANALKADDLRDFWMREDRELYDECNPKEV